jgi:hypothetical protein
MALSRDLRRGYVVIDERLRDVEISLRCQKKVAAFTFSVFWGG